MLGKPVVGILGEGLSLPKKKSLAVPEEYRWGFLFAYVLYQHEHRFYKDERSNSCLESLQPPGLRPTGRNRCFGQSQSNIVSSCILKHASQGRLTTQPWSHAPRVPQSSQGNARSLGMPPIPSAQSVVHFETNNGVEWVCVATSGVRLRTHKDCTDLSLPDIHTFTATPNWPGPGTRQSKYRHVPRRYICGRCFRPKLSCLHLSISCRVRISLSPRPPPAIQGRRRGISETLILPSLSQ